MVKRAAAARSAAEAKEESERVEDYRVAREIAADYADAQEVTDQGNGLLLNRC